VEVVEHLGGDLTAFRGDGVVDGAELLVALPGPIHLIGEVAGVEALPDLGLLLLGEVFRAVAEQPANLIERIVLASDPEGPDTLTRGSTRRLQPHPSMLIYEEPRKARKSACDMGIIHHDGSQARRPWRTSLTTGGAMFEEGRQLSADEAKTIVRRRFEELDQGNLGIIDELFSPDYKLNFPGREPLDLQKTKQFYEEMYQAFSDLRHEIAEQIAEGNKVVTRWTATGTHVSEFLGVQPTNERVSFQGINIYTFEGDKLIDSQVAWDLGPLNKRIA
jgi:predicted ester cyclase